MLSLFLRLKLWRILLVFNVASIPLHASQICDYTPFVSQSLGRLNTDLLRERWGKISIKILGQTPENRQVFFLDANKIVRGFAKTRYTSPTTHLPGPLAEAQTHIERGASIGETFRNLGFEILKDDLKETIGLTPKALRKMLGLESLHRSYHFKVRVPSGQIYSYAFIDEWTALH